MEATRAGCYRLWALRLTAKWQSSPITPLPAAFSPSDSRLLVSSIQSFMTRLRRRRDVSGYPERAPCASVSRMDLEITYRHDPDGTKKATIPARTKEWASAFIREHSGKDVAAIEAVAQEGHDELLHGLADLSDGEATFSPTNDEWSILDAMAHVISVKRTVVQVCRLLAGGSRPPAAEQWEEESRQDGMSMLTLTSVAGARDLAEQAHGEIVEFIRQLDGADLGSRLSHYLFGPLNAREWAVFVRIHDGDHIAQIWRLRSAPDSPTTSRDR